MGGSVIGRPFASPGWPFLCRLVASCAEGLGCGIDDSIMYVWYPELSVPPSPLSSLFTPPKEVMPANETETLWLQPKGVQTFMMDSHQSTYEMEVFARFPELGAHQIGQGLRFASDNSIGNVHW